MPTPTYTPLANITLSSAASSIVFGSIPATYRDLVIVFVGGATSTSDGRIRLNGDAGSNYRYQRISGSGSGSGGAAAAATRSAAEVALVAKAAATSLQLDINIMDYSATDINTAIISRAGNAAIATEAYANRWSNNAAVTSVTIFTSAGSWAVGTTAAIYGIVA
jgi:hypothetical protein